MKLINKTSKTLSHNEVFTLPDGVTISSVDSNVSSPSGLSVSSVAIGADNTSVDLDITSGVSGVEYNITLIVTGSDAIEYSSVVIVVVSDSGVQNDNLYYGTVYEANDYFLNRLGSECWTLSSNEDRRKGLFMASKALDKLNFTGSKTVATQSLQFPRGTDTEVPWQISEATYEEALSLLSGDDPNLEYENLRQISSKFGPTNSSYNVDMVPPNIVAGIMSPIAWRYLLPFLRSSRHFSIDRV